MDKTLDDGSWRVQARADSTVLEECYYDPATESSCQVGAPGGQTATFGGLAANSLSFGIWCTPYGGGGGCAGGYAIHRAHIVVFATEVTIDDPTPPDSVAVSGVPSGWRRGTVAVTVAGRDALGVKRREVLIDGVSRGSADSPCDETSLTPCASPGAVLSGPVDVDTSAVAEGTHSIAARVTDAAGNTTVGSAQSIAIDNTPPGAPSVSRVESLWTDAGAGHRVAVDVPTQTAAPIDAVRTQACLGDLCTAILTTPVDTPGAHVVDVADLPADGLWTVRTWLRDAVGNESPPQDGAETVAGVDTTPPSAQLEAPASVLEGTAITAEARDLWDPEPSSGMPSAVLTVSIDGGAAAPLPGGTAAIRAEAGHTYAVAAAVSDPVGNTRTYTQTISVTPRPATTTDTTPTTSTVPTTPGGPGPPATTPTTVTTPRQQPPARVAAGLRIDGARRVGRVLTVTGRAERRLARRRVAIELRVPTTARTTTRTATAAIRSNGRWTVRLRLPRTTVVARLRGRTVVARTARTLTVHSGVARRRLAR